MRRSGVRRFSPLALFAASETGVWYDPSDLTTLFQDTAGITPVTAAGQTVALMLDKSRVPAPEARRNLLFLSQSIQTSPWIGNFVSGASSTELSPDGVTFAAAITGPGDTGTRWSQSYASAPIATYTFSVWLRAATNFDTEMLLMGQSSIISVTTSWQRFSITRTTSSIATLVAGFRPSRTAGVTRTVFAWGGQLEVGAAATTYQPTGTIYPTAWLGTHATQATAAARPTYSIEPMTGRRNLILYSVGFGGAWAGSNASITPNAVAAPDGTITANRLNETTATGTHYGFYDSFVVGFTLPVNITRTVSFHVKPDQRSRCRVGLYTASLASGFFADFNLSTGVSTGTGANGTGSVGTAAIQALADGWFRVSVSGIASTNDTTLYPILLTADASGNISYTGSTGSGLWYWGAQLELGSTATAYQRVTTQFDVTEAGVASKSYLSFDGVDDNMVTGTITPGSADKAQVFAGVRKLTDATQGMIVEYSANVDTNNGTFFLMGARSGGGVPNYGFRSKGTILGDADATGYTAPITNVLGALGDISGDRATLRVNATQVTQSTGDQGTGNYLAYPLYIGRRGGTSLPYNGNVYSLITRFSAANMDAATITNTETWVNSKTGAY